MDAFSRVWYNGSYTIAAKPIKTLELHYTMIQFLMFLKFSNFVFDEIRGVWIADETLSRVFDISSQSKLNLRRKRRNKIVKIYAD